MLKIKLNIGMNTMKSLPSTSVKEENYIIELWRLVTPYKWLIVSMMLLSLVLAKVYLYSKPSIYESYAIIKANRDISADTVNRDFLSENLFKANKPDVPEEISTLKTYQLNNKVLNKVDFKIQYFIEDKYKKVELYDDLPIKITNLTMLDEFKEKYLVLYPKENGFVLFSKKKGESKLYSYGKDIETEYFRANVIKNREFTEPIYLMINGDNRDIYEGYIKNNLDVARVSEESNFLRVSFQDTVPKRATDYVNTLINEYVKQSLYKKETRNNKIIKFLDDQLEKTRVKLALSEEKLRGYQSENKSINPEVKSTNLSTKLGDLDLRLSEVVLKEQLIDNLKIYIKNNRNFDAIAPTLLEFNDQSTIRLIDALNALHVEEDTLATEYTDRYPKLIQIRKRATEIKEKIASNIKSLGAVLKIKHKNILKQKKKYESILTTLPTQEKKLISFQRSYALNSKMYTYLLEKKSENELIKVTAISDYEIVDQAYASPTPVGPNKKMVFIVAIILGLGLGAVIAFMRFILIDKVKTRRDVELLTKLPIYGNIPLYKNKGLMNVSLEEAYRKLAMNLQFSKKEDEGNIVLVTSAVHGEGKTTTIVNLSSIIQGTKYKSIIVDLDMHTPSVHAHFGMQQQYAGVSTYLSNRDNLGNVIFTTNYPNLNIIPSGPTPPNPMELILSPRLEELLSTLKREYDYIFIDTGSFDVAQESFYLMRHSDINLVVLREGFSKKSSIPELEKMVHDKQLKNVGLVLKTLPVKEKKKSSPPIPLVINKVKPNNLIL